MTAPAAMAADGFGLYVHIPFCVCRCRYCAFHSSLYDADLCDRYLDALERELAANDVVANTTTETVFIGGGTPSILSFRQLDRLFSFLPQADSDSEKTLEGNPESLTEDKLRLARDRGINRVSIGVQTFSAAGLSFLGRAHDAATAVKAIEAAQRAGFDRINIDVISAWPGETLAEFREDLRIADGLGVTHLSCYNLIFEDGTALTEELAAGKVSEKSDAETRRFWDEAEEALGRYGFDHYEVSNFAKPDHCCRHNVACWRGNEYLGVGAAAHSHVGGRRWANISDIAAYCERSLAGDEVVAFSEQLDPAAKAREGAVLWLRMTEGIDAAAFARRFGIELDRLYAAELPPLLSSGALEFAVGDDGRRMLRLGAEAFPNADSVLVDLV